MVLKKQCKNSNLDIFQSAHLGSLHIESYLRVAKTTLSLQMSTVHWTKSPKLCASTRMRSETRPEIERSRVNKQVNGKYQYQDGEWISLVQEFWCMGHHDPCVAAWAEAPEREVALEFSLVPWHHYLRNSHISGTWLSPAIWCDYSKD